ncbi:MAG: class I SAM-dependent methyltransferase [Acidobacteria bacterium]|nr:MAG: class I SAM-dependent methyltransferase [Acidobacteriota bacterium]
MLRKVRDLLPKPLVNALRPVYWLFGCAWYRVKYGFLPPPLGTDLVGYEALIEFIKANRILNLPGDVLEVGAFCGGGTYKLAKFVTRKAEGKKIYVIDCFDIDYDKTECTAGIQMAQLYAEYLKGKSQKELFCGVTRGLQNVQVIPEDSKLAVIPTDAICFAFVDGNHAPAYVLNDFRLAWGKLTRGGVAAFHDYGSDLPEVTAILDELCAQHRDEISNCFVDKEKHILFIQKRPA